MDTEGGSIRTTIRRGAIDSSFRVPYDVICEIPRKKGKVSKKVRFRKKSAPKAPEEGLLKHFGHKIVFRTWKIKGELC